MGGLVALNGGSSFSVGGADPTVVPFQITPITLYNAYAGAYTNNGTGNIFQLSSYITQSGTQPAVAVFGQGQATASGAEIWGGNFVGVSTASGATGLGAELDAVVMASGGSAFSLVLGAAGNFPATGAMQIQSNNANAVYANGIIFNTSNFKAATTAFITSIGTNFPTNGFDFTSGTFGSYFMKSAGFTVDKVGNVVAAADFVPFIIGGTTANSSLTLRSTSAAGTTDSINFQTGSQVTALTIDTTQKATFSALMEVAGYAIASLPTCNTAAKGSHAYVTNGQTTPTFLGTVSTTGAVVAPVFCNGTAWIYALVV
jgi:hypothetical protein